MKIRIERTDLLKALSHAQSVVERRHTIPILANALVEASGDAIHVRATDLDAEIDNQAPAKVERAGRITVPCALLHEITRKLPDGAQVMLAKEDQNQRLQVTAGRSRFDLPTLPDEDFPTMDSSEYETEFTMGSAALLRLFDKAKFAMSQEETRYYLNGVYMHISQKDQGAVLCCVATDGHRLACIETELPEGAAEMASVIVPRKTVNELCKLLEDDAAEIRVSVSSTKLRFATAESVLTSKVIDGSFPDYARVIPSNNARKLTVDADDLARAVGRVATVSSDRTRAVKLALTADQVILSVTAADGGSGEEDLAIAYEGEPMEMGFNAKYLEEIAERIDHENAVFLLGDSGDPALIRDGEDDSALYVVMPMRV
ncbi:MAG: DNA polymerase III subunit beta [Rhodobacteraceae bacterium]|nr:DNA polymerase III subunit beta [Paracoccaceae bacterium]